MWLTEYVLSPFPHKTDECKNNQDANSQTSYDGNSRIGLNLKEIIWNDKIQNTLAITENWIPALSKTVITSWESLISTWNMEVCLSSLVNNLLFDSTDEAVAVSLLHSHSAADIIEIIRTSDCLCRSSREEVSLTVQPQHLRLWIPAWRLTQ